MDAVLSHYICYLLHSTRDLLQDLPISSCQHHKHNVYHVDNDGNGNSTEFEITFLKKKLNNLEKCKILSLQVFVLLVSI